MSSQRGKGTLSQSAKDNLACPPTVTWDADIAKLFTQAEVDCMKSHTGGALDLSSYDSVMNWGPEDIYGRVSSTDPTFQMPPPNSGQPAWNLAMKNIFACWIKLGCVEK